MNIYEKDLFNFIFYPKELNFYKYFYIHKNLDKYRCEFSILLEMLKMLEKSIDNRVLCHIIDRIVNSEEIIEEIDVDYS